MNNMQKKDVYPLLSLLLPAALISLITALAYWPSLHYDFQFDDIANIQKHFNIRHYSFSGLFFTGSRWISYWLNSVYYKIGKFDPFAYRVGNLLIHISNGLLLFLVTYYALSYLKKKSFFTQHAFKIASICSLIFLLHPVQTQTVSYVIQGQLEGLSTFFILSMLCVYFHRAYTHNPTTRFLLSILFLCLAALSCGTKEIAIISPALILLFDWFFIAQGNVRSLISRLWLFAIATITILGWYIYFLKPQFFTNIIGLQMHAKNNIGNVITHAHQELITPWLFFISQFKVILHYIGIFFWPFNISVEYDWMLVKNFFAFDCIVPLIVLLSLAGLTIKTLLKNPINPACFGILWFFVCIAPRSSIIPSPELLVDYKTYMASYGLIFLIACALIVTLDYLISLHHQIDFYKKQTAFSIVLIGALSLAYCTYKRNIVWSSGKEFWGNIIANAPGKARAYNNYGVELSQHFKQYTEAVPYFKKAIEMDSNYPDPCNNLAVAYSHLGDTDAAIEALKKGLKINPYYPEGYNNLASFFLQQEKYDQAEKILLHALKLRPHYGKAKLNLGKVYLARGDKEKAWECFKQACTQADLDNVLGFSTYAKVSLSLKKYDDALFAYKKVLELEPSNQDALFNAGNTCFFMGDYPQAIKYLSDARTINPQDVRIWYNLGESLFKTGAYAQAVESFEHIRSLNQQLPHMNLRIASCYEKIGNNQKAKEALQEIVTMKHANIPENVKTLAQEYLAQLEHKGKDAITA